MFGDFRYFNPTKIVYGVDKVKTIGDEIVGAAGEKCDTVIVTDPGVLNVGIIDKVSAALQSAGIQPVIYSDVKGNPSFNIVDDAAKIVRETKSKIVVGVGGGSAIDVAKLAALTALDDKPAEAFYDADNPLEEKDLFNDKTIKTIMIPTTAGTGAEVTRAGVYNTSNGIKVWIGNNKLMPEVALLDPTLTTDLPPNITAATGLDALVHAIEAVLSTVTGPMIEAISLKSIRLVSSSLEKAMNSPNDLELRGNLLVGAMMAGLSIASAACTVGHALGHALSSVGGIHHGRAVTIALNAFFKFNIEGNVSGHARVAEALGVDPVGKNERELAYAGADEFEKLIKATGINNSLREDGLTVHKDLDRIVELALRPENHCMTECNPRTVSKDDLIKYTKCILEQ